MSDRVPNIPHYEVHRRGDDVPLRSMGHELLARLVAITPGFTPTITQLKVVEAADGISVHRLHEVVTNLASLFVLTAVEPDATHKLDAAEQRLGQIADIWESPEEGIRAMFPQASTERPLTPSEMAIPDQARPTWQSP